MLCEWIKPLRTAFMALLIATGLTASSDAVEPARALALHPFVGRLRTIEIEIGGRRATLLFDTGAGITSITPEFAAQVGCAPQGHVVGFRMDGERAQFQRCAALSADVAGWRFHRDFGVFDLHAVLPHGLPDVDGVAGLDLFDGQVITIESNLSGLRLETPASLLQRVATARQGRMRIARESAGVALTVFCPATSQQGDVWLLLDSGNLAGVRLHPWAASALGIAAQGTHVSQATLRVAGAAAQDAEAEIVDSLIYDGALDARFLAAHAVTLDLRRGRIWWRSA